MPDGTLRLVPPTVDRQTLFEEAHAGKFGGHLRELLKDVCQIMGLRKVNTTAECPEGPAQAAEELRSRHETRFPTCGGPSIPPRSVSQAREGTQVRPTFPWSVPDSPPL